MWKWNTSKISGQFWTYSQVFSTLINYITSTTSSFYPITWMNTFWSTAYEAQNSGINIRHNNSFWMTESAGIRYLKELKCLSTQFQMKQYLNKNHHHPIFLLPLSYNLQKSGQIHIISIISLFIMKAKGDYTLTCWLVTLQEI